MLDASDADNVRHSEPHGMMAGIAGESRITRPLLSIQGPGGPRPCIVVDKRLTGFDAAREHGRSYLARPMKAQPSPAIARVHRVFVNRVRPRSPFASSSPTMVILKDPPPRHLRAYDPSRVFSEDIARLRHPNEAISSPAPQRVGFIKGVSTHSMVLTLVTFRAGVESRFLSVFQKFSRSFTVALAVAKLCLRHEA